MPQFPQRPQPEDSAGLPDCGVQQGLDGGPSSAAAPKAAPAGGSCLTVSALETGEYKGTWLGGQEMRVLPILEIVSAVSTHCNGLGPLELGEAGEPWAWFFSGPALPSFPNPLCETGAPSHQKQGWGMGGLALRFRSANTVGFGVREP